VTKAEAIIGWSPSVSTQQGIDQMLEWVGESRGIVLDG